MKSASTAYMAPGLAELLRKLGHGLQAVRKMQRLRLTDLATNAGCSVGTLRRLEAGDPGVSIGVLASVLAQLQHAEALAAIVGGVRDSTMQAMQEEMRLPRRIRPRRTGTQWPDDDEAVAAYEDD
jgi:transcriptional regulator with XRE-family HTH domain